MKDANKRLLTYVVNALKRVQPRTQLDQQQFAEIGDKMLFGSHIAPTEPLQVGFIKAEEFHGSLKEGASIFSPFSEAQSNRMDPFASLSLFSRDCQAIQGTLSFKKAQK